MSFTTILFDELLCDLGELATLRDEALRRPEIARSPAMTDALEALAEVVPAVARAALSGGAVSEVASARDALTRAQRRFGPIAALLAEGRPVARAI
jgi:hypothetical protein